MIKSKTLLMTGATLILLGILFGAFGAHGLKTILDETKMNTFQTGVNYQFYHGFGLLFLGLLKLLKPELKLNAPAMLMFAGIILFCLNCYLYALSGVKIFAAAVPVGGVSFILAWVSLVAILRRI